MPFVAVGYSITSITMFSKLNISIFCIWAVSLNLSETHCATVNIRTESFKRKRKIFFVKCLRFIHEDANKLDTAVCMFQPWDVKWAKQHPPPSDSSSLQGFPKTPSSLGSVVWYRFWPSCSFSKVKMLRLKMHFRADLSEAKDEEDRALTSPTKLALRLSSSLLWPA